MKVTSKRTGWDPFLVFPTSAAILFGLIGIVPGLAFLGPFGQGSTMQMGFLLGCAGGFAAAMLELSTKRFLIALLMGSAMWAAVLSVWRRSYLAGI